MIDGAPTREAVDQRPIRRMVKRRPGSRLSGERLVSIATPLVLLVAWEISARMGLIDTRILGSPVLVANEIASLTRDGTLVSDTVATVVRFVVGFFVGAVPGTLIGLTMGLFRWPRAVLQPLVAAVYPLPRIALFPIILILIGLNETSNILMVALGPFFTMIITTVAGVQNIEPIYRQVAQSFGARRRDLYRLVVFPGALPVIMGGVRLSVGLAMLNTVAVEFLVGDSGLGYLIWRAFQLLSIQQSLAGLVIAGIIGSLAYQSVGWLERRVVPWRQVPG